MFPIKSFSVPKKKYQYKFLSSNVEVTLGTNDTNAILIDCLTFKLELSFNQLAEAQTFSRNDCFH